MTKLAYDTYANCSDMQLIQCTMKTAIDSLDMNEGYECSMIHSALQNFCCKEGNAQCFAFEKRNTCNKLPDLLVTFTGKIIFK